jgi:type IV pilus assembly protein PilV
MPLRRDPSLRLSSGFTLMEVLIAMVVMGVGIITIVELQTDALTGSQQSGARMHAAVLASGMADRIRANPAGQGNYDGMTVGTAPTSNSNCYNTTCNANQLATHDVWRWQQKLGNTLPGGEGIVCRDSSPDDGTGQSSPSCDGDSNDPFAVKVWWTRKSTEQGQSANTSRLYVLTFRPNG